MDALSDVLATLQLRGRELCRLELGTPWGIEHPETGIARFYVVEGGQARLGIAEHEFRLTAGDLVVLPHGSAHRLGDGAPAADTPFEEIVAQCDPRAVVHYLRFGGDGATSVLLTGVFLFEHVLRHPLLDALPPVIHLPGEDGRAMPWMESTLRFLADEATAQRPGMELILSRLRDVLFVQAVRAWLGQPQQPGQREGWRHALQDPVIAKAIRFMHRDLEKDWTVDALARAVGQSRSAFAARFQDLVGESPIGYLARVRMQVAARLLRLGELSVKEVATRVGYATEAAFSKAFKRELGQAPGAWRRDGGVHRGIE